uniref:Uncharacterized protein n=1 Tax=Cacopsylla melanoneura TaxID=428564 RepID=A0A8D8WD37_9HEMI
MFRVVLTHQYQRKQCPHSKPWRRQLTPTTPPPPPSTPFPPHNPQHTPRMGLPRRMGLQSLVQMVNKVISALSCSVKVPPGSVLTLSAERMERESSCLSSCKGVLLMCLGS